MPDRAMTRLVLRNLRYYWRSNLAVLLGVATAVAVLAGALLVGQSVRASLLDLLNGADRRHGCRRLGRPSVSTGTRRRVHVDRRGEWAPGLDSSHHPQGRAHQRVDETPGLRRQRVRRRRAVLAVPRRACTEDVRRQIRRRRWAARSAPWCSDWRRSAVETRGASRTSPASRSMAVAKTRSARSG